jgi:hypothetical protein
MFSLAPSPYRRQKTVRILLLEISVLRLIEFDEIFGDEWSEEEEVLY